MKIATRRIAAAALVALLVLPVALTTGCAKKAAPKLTPEQLSAGVIGGRHPVSQEAATQQGCACHLQAQ